ncbi:MAG: AraC family transcriptional regulator [bacterium]
MTEADSGHIELQACQALAKRLTEPRDLFAGVRGFLTTLPVNPLQFHRHSDRHLNMGAPFLHHRFVLVACLSEPGSIVMEGKVFHIESGQGLLIFPYQSHYYARLEHPERISWLFTTFEFEAPEKLELLRNTPFSLNVQDLRRLRQVTESYLDTRQDGEGMTHDMPLELALFLSGVLRRQSHQRNILTGKTNPDGLQVQFFRPLFAYINQHLDGSLQMGDLAKCVHLSPSRLRARFKHTLGIGLGEFIRHTRIQRACGLLNSTDLNVTQVSEKCGFNSVYAFSRTFRTIVGIPPTAFRTKLSS